MKFWDTSAILPLLVRETSSGILERTVLADREMVVWWAAPVECASALAQREQSGELSVRAANAAAARLRGFAAHWAEVAPSEAIRVAAEHALRVHPLRAGDSLQLAAALALRGAPADGVAFVCLDARLRMAALREGLAVEPAERGSAVRERMRPLATARAARAAAKR